MWATTKKLPASFFRFPSSPAEKATRTNKRSSSTRPNRTFRLMTRPSNFQPRNSIYAFSSSLLSFVLILVSAPALAANEAPYNSATISGLGARNIGSAAMSGRISAIAGVKEPSAKLLFSSAQPAVEFGSRMTAALFPSSIRRTVSAIDRRHRDRSEKFQEYLGRQRRIVDTQQCVNWGRHLQIKRWRRDLDQCRITEVGTHRPNCH